jgi:6-pyruvoyl-tetrahydropterin synthase related domain
MNDSFQEQQVAARGRIRGWIPALGVSLVVSLAIVLPFFWLGSASGHDFEFHVASWLDVSYQWSEGVFFPRWTAWTNHGFGEPRYIFYPPLSWMLGAALTRSVPLTAVPLAYVLLTQTLAGFCAYFLLRRLTCERAALLGAACYVANPNALLMTYLRSDFAEQLACAIFPLMLLGALRLTNLIEERPEKRSSIPAFAVSLAAVWLCNAPAGVIASYSMALLIGWAAVTQRSGRIILRGAAAIALGLGLAGFYLVPAAYEQRWVNISQALSSGLLPWQNFLFTRIADVDHTWFNTIASWCAVVLMLALGACALASQRFGSSAAPQGRFRKVWDALLVLGTGATLLMLPISEILWSHLPKLRFVQFPWRFMSIVALVYACFLAAVAEKRRGWLAVILIFVLSVPVAVFLVNDGWWDPDEMPTQQAAISNKAGFDGTDEYDPVGDDHLDLPAMAPDVKVIAEGEERTAAQDVQVKILKWRTEQKEVAIDARESVRLAMHLLNYPAWRVTVNGRLVQPDRMDDINQMAVTVERGKSVIEIQFVRTMDRTVGNLVSVVSLGIAGLLIFRRRKSALTDGRAIEG